MSGPVFPVRPPEGSSQAKLFLGLWMCSASVFSISSMGVCSGRSIRSQAPGDVMTAVSAWHVPQSSVLKKSLLAHWLVKT